MADSQLPEVHQVLFVQPAFIGDVILFTGLLETWHVAWPRAAVDVWVRKGNERLFADHPFVREVRVWDKSHARYAALLGQIRSVRSARYDAVITPHRHASSGLLAGLSGAPIRVGFKQNPWSFLFTRRVRHVLENGGHEVERNHGLIAPWCPDRRLPRLYPGTDHAIPETWRGAIVLAPASQWFTKQWPPEKWVALLHQLAHHAPETPVVLMGGPADASLVDSLLQRSRKHPRVFRTPAKASLDYAAAVIQRAACVVSNDSAPLHLASALGVRAVAIYCSTVPAFGFGPLTPGSTIIEAEEELPCRPCGAHGHKKCPEGHFQCARSIGAERVRDAVLNA